MLLDGEAGFAGLVLEASATAVGGFGLLGLAMDATVTVGTVCAETGGGPTCVGLESMVVT